ncbi:hypothetical protein Asi03nite_25460 [Actinoplanes siamensis]|uniref:Uncharacterized protein n=1 Tax=Actinoplanes siamensis TaxID=1223317 RepID=A0A919N5V9_9ACTN|nr:hypothetical protein Asi03nite_25460 [Actinoplanes siamensis]
MATSVAWASEETGTEVRKVPRTYRQPRSLTAAEAACLLISMEDIIRPAFGLMPASLV